MTATSSQVSDGSTLELPPPTMLNLTPVRAEKKAKSTTSTALTASSIANSPTAKEVQELFEEEEETKDEKELEFKQLIGQVIGQFEAVVSNGIGTIQQSQDAHAAQVTQQIQLISDRVCELERLNATQQDELDDELRLDKNVIKPSRTTTFSSSWRRRISSATCIWRKRRTSCGVYMSMILRSIIGRENDTTRDGWLQSEGCSTTQGASVD